MLRTQARAWAPWLLAASGLLGIAAFVLTSLLGLQDGTRAVSTLADLRRMHEEIVAVAVAAPTGSSTEPDLADPTAEAMRLITDLRMDLARLFDQEAAEREVFVLAGLTEDLGTAAQSVRSGGTPFAAIAAPYAAATARIDTLVQAISRVDTAASRSFHLTVLAGLVALGAVGAATAIALGWTWRRHHTLARYSDAREARFRALVQNAPDMIAVLAEDGSVIYGSSSFTRLWRKPLSDQGALHIHDVVDPQDCAQLLSAAVTPQLTTDAHRTVELRVRRPDGSWGVAEVMVSNLIADPAIGGIVINARDVTERKRLEDQLADQAFRDELTGLPNRALFRERAQHAISAMQYTQRGIAIALLDLDRFKDINDTLGHQAGDALLVEVARQLTESAETNVTIARFGGDEFTILLEFVNDAVEAEATIQRLVRALDLSVDLGSQRMQVSVSAGIAPAETPDAMPEELLRRADVALYRAKTMGRDRCILYDDVLDRSITERVTMEAELRHAIEAGELVLHYQPEIDFATGVVTGAEALVRWQHPTRGLLLPGEFIPLAMGVGLVARIDAWALFQACADFGVHGTGARDHLAVSVNVSPQRLREPQLVDDIQAALRTSGLAPTSLRLEVTEDVIIDDLTHATSVLEALRALGVQIAVDDFGTGYSSLSYLQRLPIDVLKLDRSFVHAACSEPRAKAVIVAVIGIADALGLAVTAEGVETVEQEQLLRGAGCRYGQGYLYARPIPLDALHALIDAWPGCDSGRTLAQVA